jgi:thiamine-monophosphate kinase
VPGEFELIARNFTRPARHAVLGVGDDCALLQTAPGMQLAVSTDMLVAGRHFFPDVDPFLLGHKCLAVNLSDLAACGARPLAFSLALALPNAEDAWLEPFSKGLLALADAHGCELIGGDTTRGPLTICITVYGEVPADAAARPVPTQALLRSGSLPGDDVYVSGSLGDAALALLALQGRLALPAALLHAARARMEQPTPRVALGLALRGIASACADISDGLLGDLGHILARSHCGARVDVDKVLPLLATRQVYAGGAAQFDADYGAHTALQCVLAGGDDYELVFTAPPAQRSVLAALSDTLELPLTRIATIEAAPGLRLVDAQGPAVVHDFASFDHFAAAGGLL